MQAKTARLLDRHMDAGHLLFRNRYQVRLAYKILLALGMAGLTGLAAQVRIPLPWSPVPITGQTFAVLLAGVLLGRYWGGASMCRWSAIMGQGEGL